MCAPSAGACAPLAVILGQGRAGVRTSSKNFEVTMRWRLGHGPESLNQLPTWQLCRPERATERPVERLGQARPGHAPCRNGRLRRGSRSGRGSFTSFEPGLDEANHPVHELEEFGGARGSRQGLGFIALVELT